MVFMIKKIFYGWWIVLACFIISLYMASVVFFGFTAFFEPLIREFGWSYAQVSFAASLRGMEMGIFAPLVGLLADRFGSRKIILCGVITVGFGLGLLSFTRSLAMFYGSILLLAFGAGGCSSVVTMSAVANWFKRDVGKALGVMSCGFGASGLLIPVIVWLMEFYTWRTALIILAFGMLVLGIPLSLVIRNKPEQYGYRADGAMAVDIPIEEKTQYENTKIGFKEFLRERDFLYLSLAESIRMMTVAAVVVHVMPYLSSVGVSRSTAGMVAAGIPLFSIMGRFGFGWLGDLFDKRYMMAVVYCFMGAGMVAFIFGQSGWMIFFFLLLFPPGFGGSMVLRGAILREYFGRASFGKMIGMLLGIASIGGIIGPTLAGWAFDCLGSYYYIWFAFAGCVSISVMVILRIKS